MEIRYNLPESVVQGIAPIRLTRIRKMVLSALTSEGKAMKANEIVNFLADIYQAKVPAVTVYRTLEYLQLKKFVYRLNQANKFIAIDQKISDSQQGYHQFLVCEKCGAVGQNFLPIENLKTIAGFVTGTGFSLAEDHLEISCVCASCVAKDKQEAEDRNRVALA